MLSPEVNNFDAPKSIFTIRKGNFEDFNCEAASSFYNHMVTFVLPDTVNFPSKLTELLTEDTEYYKVKDVAVKKLIDLNFLYNYVRKGQLTLISIGGRVDCDNCVCITPTGELILLLLKETYQSLGLEGKLPFYSQRNKSHYIVRINLKKSSFDLGKKNYDRVLKGLSKLENFTVLVSWHPPTPNICPSSIAKEFKNFGYEVEVVKPKLEKYTEYSVKVPLLNIATATEDDVSDFIEWLGMLLVKGDMKPSHEYLSWYETPEPNHEVGQVKVLKIRGFFTSKQIEIFYNELKNLTDADDKKWVAMFVQGFSDSIINWKMKENHFYTNGDYSSVSILSSLHYLVCKQSCSNKYYSH